MSTANEVTEGSEYDRRSRAEGECGDLIAVPGTARIYLGYF
jgi:hypothetical protein